MSREIKWTTELREISVCKEGDLVCDNCGKHFDVLTQKGTFYTITSGHHDWGNDSEDSFNDQDACCNECLIALVNKWTIEWEGYPTAFIDIRRSNFEKLRRKNGD